MAELSGKAVAITGASSGIGEATALALAKAGASVALGARRKDRIDALAARIEDEGGTAVPLEVDVADEAQAREFVDDRPRPPRPARLADQQRRRDAARPGRAGRPRGAGGRWSNVNLLGLLYCTHAALPIMREQGSGDIVNISSVAGRFARAGSAVYNLTKFGVNAYSEGLRQEVTQAGIRIIVVEPGFVDTELQGHNEGAGARDDRGHARATSARCCGRRTSPTGSSTRSPSRRTSRSTRS